MQAVQNWATSAKWSGAKYGEFGSGDVTQQYMYLKSANRFRISLFFSVFFNLMFEGRLRWRCSVFLEEEAHEVVADDAVRTVVVAVALAASVSCPHLHDRSTSKQRVVSVYVMHNRIKNIQR